MFTEPKNGIIKDDFYWMVTRYVYFELERFELPTMTLLNSKELIQNLIKFHEKRENYEICAKIMSYKSKMKDV